MTATIGLFYGSSTCYTEMAAEKIRDQLGQNLVDIHNIADADPCLMEDYSFLILGIPTWDYGELQEDWEEAWDELDNVDFNGRYVAIYGLGDQVGYPEWFQDAMGYLWAKVVNLGAISVGRWPSSGYTFHESKALTADGSQFVGLPLDDENQFDLSEERIARWCRQIMEEFGLS